MLLEHLFDYLPLLGFILRSTNVRNAFEAFGPIRRLANSLLALPGAHPGTNPVHLLLSSEWDYSPFIYDEIPGLPRFLMIGLPAPESSNPLLLPLAGHELGHCLWRERNLDGYFRPEAKASVVDLIKGDWSNYDRLFQPSWRDDQLTTNLFAIESWQPAVDWALAQAQETFCDFLGLLIFGPSYLHAFAYLLAPALGRRALTYPQLRTRAENLVWVLTAVDQKSAEFDNYIELFETEAAPRLSKRDEFLLLIADNVLAALRQSLLTKAQELVASAGLGNHAREQEEQVVLSLGRVVPAEGAGSIVPILNGAWRAFHATNLWEDLPEVNRSRDLVLRELTPKSFEVLEFELLTEGAE